MQPLTPGQVNIVIWDVDSRVTGVAITDGTLAMYMQATKGDHVGEWWDGSAWSVSEVTCGQGVHVSNGHWAWTVETAAVESLAEYVLYGVHSSGLQSDYSEILIASYKSSSGLSGGSGVEDAIYQYNDNLGWRGDLAKAVLALEALEFLNLNRPVSGSARSKSFNYEGLAESIKEIAAFVSARSTTAAVRGSTFVAGKARMI